MVILSQDMINALRVHRYSSQGHGILEFESVFNFIAEKLPSRLSPNSITLLGLSSSYIACILAIYQSCNDNKEGFQAMSYFCVFGYFMWLVCDNIDGKVARLRRVSGPFGELLDHGGDAVGMLLASATIISSFNFHGAPLGTFAYIVSDVVASYISEPYSIYIRGTLQKESIDFNEIVLIFMVISWLTASYGTNIWLYEIIPAIHFQLRYIFYIIKFYIILMLFVGKFMVYFTRDPLSEKTKMSKIRPLIPLLIVLTAATIAYITSSEEFLRQYVVQLSFCYGFSIVRLHIELLIAYIVKSDDNLINLSLVFPILLAFCIAISGDPSKEMLVTLLFLVATVFDTAIYFFRLLFEIYCAMDVKLCILDGNENVTTVVKQ